MPAEKTKQYIMLEKKAIEIYLEHGCLAVEIYRDAKDPRRWMEINRFRDRTHYTEVIASVDEDPRIKPLFEEFIGLFEEGNQPEKTTYYRMI
jgi:quinol monooxygenase YgiN